VERTLQAADVREVEDLEDVLDADASAREAAGKLVTAVT
jgi:hypothetical protein